MKNILFLLTCIGFATLVNAQNNPADTVIVQLAKSSQLTLTVGDRDDLEVLQHYDFEALFEDILSRLEEDDPAIMDDFEDYMGSEYDEDLEESEEGDDFEDENGDEEDDEEEDDEEDEDMEDDCDKRGGRHFFKSTNVDFGIGNYFSADNDGGAQYTVRPWGSWYVGLNFEYHTRLREGFHIAWVLGASQYNFKFQDDRTLLTETPEGVEFTRDERDLDFIKSKLSVTYINAAILPMIEFGGYRDECKSWKGHKRDFRAGIGLYGGYRLDSFTKQVYEIDDDRKKERNRDNFYLNNLRYGVRLQFGVHESDFFFNYDLNELFAGNRGPKLNAYSFGIIF